MSDRLTTSRFWPEWKVSIRLPCISRIWEFWDTVTAGRAWERRYKRVSPPNKAPITVRDRNRDSIRFAPRTILLLLGRLLDSRRSSAMYVTSLVVSCY
ncbi:hypothetical protein D3C76_1457070 [compost metagenome]